VGRQIYHVFIWIFLTILYEYSKHTKLYSYVNLVILTSVIKDEYLIH